MTTLWTSASGARSLMALMTPGHVLNIDRDHRLGHALHHQRPYCYGGGEPTRRAAISTTELIGWPRPARPRNTPRRGRPPGAPGPGSWSHQGPLLAVSRGAVHGRRGDARDLVQTTLEKALQAHSLTGGTSARLSESHSHNHFIALWPSRASRAHTLARLGRGAAPSLTPEAETCVGSVTSEANLRGVWR